MRIEELSIGDWVKANGVAKRVHSIEYQNGEYFVHFSDPDTNSEDYMHAPFIEPIPITPKILEKNGFVKELEVYYERFEWRENGRVAIALHRISFSKSESFVLYTFKNGINSWLLKIEHAHQLQHALRLAGIEKQIELE